MEKVWNLAAEPREVLLSDIHEHPIIARLLYCRGIRSASEADIFLNPSYAEHTHDPFLMDDMSHAVERIIRAIADNEKVVIYGDYDIDGVCASTILYEFFASLGVTAEVYMNHRERDGYGLQLAAIEKLIDEGAQLIITNDSGISNKKEVAAAQVRGVDVIITDHHAVPENAADLPAAYAIIHPLVRANRYPFKHLAGGATAFKLIQALIRTEGDAHFQSRKSAAKNADGSPVNWEAFEKWLLDLVCISTIGDCMPLIGENRTFVRYGLRVLNQTRRLGLKSLISTISTESKTLTTETIGFFIGPRINAASRMEHGKTAFQLMVARNVDEANRLSHFLEEKNTERKQLTELITKEVESFITPALEANKKILIAYKDGWPLGVLGLVAGKFAQNYHRPVILITNAHGTRSGTGRSIPTFHLADFFKKMSRYLAKHGGHAAAGGFALSDDVNINEFIDACEREGDLLIADADLVPTLSIDTEMSLRDATLELADLLDSFAPHGQQNQKPCFLLSNVFVSDIRTIGKTNKHLRLTIEQDGIFRKVIGFSFGSWIDRISAGCRIDCVCEIDINEWNGVKEVQLKLVDLRQTLS